MQTKEFIDPYHGFDDIQNKILKSPNLNFFPQDPLRLLRVMQFAGRFDMQIDAQLSKVCSAMDVASLAQERVEQEFEKLFTKSKYPSKGLMWLFSIKKWQQFLPVELEMQKVYDAVDFIAQTSLKDAEKIILMWSACLLLSAPCQDKNITMQYKEAVKKLSLKGIYQRHIIAYCMQFSYAVKIKNEIQVKWLAYYLASHGTVHEMCILLQSVGEGAQAKKINELAKKSQVLFKPIQALLHGKDLQSHAQGKALGVLLEKAYQMQLEHEYISKKNLLDLLLK
jgi:tRNA nucleotidyltransferase/poly(A) polymerase